MVSVSGQIWFDFEIGKKKPRPKLNKEKIYKENKFCQNGFALDLQIYLQPFHHPTLTVFLTAV